MAFGIDRSRGAKNICVTESSDSGTNDNIILMDGETLSKAISLHSLSIDPSTLFQLKTVFLESFSTFCEVHKDLSGLAKNPQEGDKKKLFRTFDIG